MSMKLASWFLLGLVFWSGPGVSAQALHTEAAGKPLFTSGVLGSNPDQMIAGVASGTAPWVVSSGTLSVYADGTIKGKIRGLIIPGTGVGPVTKVAVSLVSGGSGGAVVATTQSFDLSPDGDVKIADKIDLPAQVVAPVLLVRITALDTGDLPAPINWIASSGLGGATNNLSGRAAEAAGGAF